MFPCIYLYNFIHLTFILQMNGTSPPAPTRGLNRGSSTENDDDADDVDSGPAVINVQDLVPRTNISDQLTSSLFTDLSDKNWKVNISIFLL